MEKKEIPIDFPLPTRLSPKEVEELRGISRKLGKGMESLKKIERSASLNTELTGKNTEILQDIKLK